MREEVTTEVISFQQALSVFGLQQPDYIRVNTALTNETGAQFEVIRTLNHDGTLAFSKEVLSKAIDAILGKTCYYAPEGYDGVIDRTYIVGDVTITKQFMQVELPIGVVPGVRETVRIPVIAQQFRTNP